jgi:hypothetical protein
MLRRAALSYFGGAVGGLVSAVVLWIAGRAELTGMLGVAISPALRWSWLADRILWGGLWGLGYPLALRLARDPLRGAFLLSLAPTCAQLLYFLPRAGESLFGTSLGVLTPLVVLAANAVWGWTLAHVAMAAGEGRSG